MYSKTGTILQLMAVACGFTIPLISNRFDNPYSKGILLIVVVLASIGFVMELRAMPSTRDRMSLLIPIGGMILYYMIKILGRMF